MATKELNLLSGEQLENAIKSLTVSAEKAFNGDFEEPLVGDKIRILGMITTSINGSEQLPVFAGQIEERSGMKVSIPIKIWPSWLYASFRTVDGTPHGHTVNGDTIRSEKEYLELITDMSEGDFIIACRDSSLKNCILPVFDPEDRTKKIDDMIKPKRVYHWSTK